ncbi:MAG: TonB-dependent receptor [Akkermansiaceae bacterium]
MNRIICYLSSLTSILTHGLLSADESVSGLEASVVVGVREASALSDTLLEADDIAEIRVGGTDFQQLLQSVPGAYAGNPTAGVFSIRGVNQDGLFGGIGAQTSPLISVFEDDVPLSTTTLRYLSPPAFGLSSFEVSKGPQNYQPGPSTIAGSLHLKSATPGFEFSGKSVVEYSEFGTLNTFLSQDMTLIPDELALGLSYHHFETDGEAEAPAQNDSEFGAFDRDRYKAQLLWHPGKNKDNSFLLTLLHDEAGGNPQSNTTIIPGSIDLFDRISNTNTPSSYPVERQLISLRSSISLPNDLMFKSATAFQRIGLGQNLDFDGNSILGWTINGAQDERLFTQSVSLAGETGAWAWVAGAYYENSSYRVAFDGVGITPIPSGSAFQNFARTDAETYALYGRFTRDLASDLKLTAGVRYQKDERELAGSSTFSIFPSSATSGDSSDDAILPSLRIDWQPEGDTALSLNAARGYRAGGVSFAPVLGVSSPYDAESSWDLEFSARHMVNDDVKVTGALFHSWMDDQQVSQTPLGGLSGVDLITTNAGESTRYGAELQIEWAPTERLNFYANTGYTKTEFDELVLNGEDRSGEAFPNAPELTVAVGVDYQHDSGFYGSINYSWADGTFSLVAAPEETGLENRSLLNARIGWAGERVNLYVFASNILDDEYGVFRTESIAPVIPQVGKAGASRMVGVGMEVKW